MSIINIVAEILSALELTKKVKDVSILQYLSCNLGVLLTKLTRQALDKVIPKPPKELEEKHRWMQCTIKNATQFPLLLHESFLDSGRYWTAPGSTAEFDQIVFSCCNQDNSLFTGVSGGNSFKIILDKDHVFDMALVRPVFKNLSDLTFQLMCTGMDSAPEWKIQSRCHRIKLRERWIRSRISDWQFCTFEKPV